LLHLALVLRVLGHAELFEPVGDLLHCRKPPRDRAYDVPDEDIRPNLRRELTFVPLPMLRLTVLGGVAKKRAFHRRPEAPDTQFP
jgi:hypothetical protein